MHDFDFVQNYANWNSLGMWKEYFIMFSVYVQLHEHSLFKILRKVSSLATP